jgi:hypothetical protein
VNHEESIFTITVTESELTLLVNALSYLEKRQLFIAAMESHQNRQSEAIDRCEAARKQPHLPRSCVPLGRRRGHDERKRKLRVLDPLPRRRLGLDSPDLHNFNPSSLRAHGRFALRTTCAHCGSEVRRKEFNFERRTLEISVLFCECGFSMALPSRDIMAAFNLRRPTDKMLEEVIPVLRAWIAFSLVQGVPTERERVLLEEISAYLAKGGVGI